MSPTVYLRSDFTVICLPVYDNFHCSCQSCFVQSRISNATVHGVEISRTVSGLGKLASTPDADGLPLSANTTKALSYASNCKGTMVDASFCSKAGNKRRSNVFTGKRKFDAVNYLQFCKHFDFCHKFEKRKFSI
jgi:hypothetical protein